MVHGDKPTHLHRLISQNETYNSGDIMDFLLHTPQCNDNTEIHQFSQKETGGHL